MRIPSFKTEAWPYPSGRRSSWRGLFSISHRRASSNSTSDSEVTSEVCPAAYAAPSDISTRSHTPEVMLDDVPSTPPAFKEKSPARLEKMKRMSLMSESSPDVTRMYPAPLQIPQRPSTSHHRSTSQDSPVSDTSNWSGNFFSTHPGVSPLTFHERPMSIFSQREYEPSTYEYPRIDPEEDLVLTITSKYPTGVAADLYVPVDVSMPARPGFRRGITDKMRPRSMATHGAFDRRSVIRPIGMAL